MGLTFVKKINLDYFNREHESIFREIKSRDGIRWCL